MASPVLGQLIVAHRGASFDAPENTLSAFRLAWEQQADAIEGDFYLTKDQQIVCVHDKSTGRTAPDQPELRIADATLEELRALDVGRWKHTRFADERMPTLDEVLACVPDGKQIFVEIKCGPEILPKLKEQLEASSLRREQITIICFNREVVRLARQSMPQYRVNWLTGYDQDKVSKVWSPTIDEVVAVLKNTGATGLGTNGNLNVIDESFAKKVLNGGFEFHVWTVNDPAEAQRFSELGVYSITTDKPALIREALESRRSQRVGAYEPPYVIEHSVVTQGYDGTQCWVHARPGVIPAAGNAKYPKVIVTTQPLEITGSDVFRTLHSTVSHDLGATWTPLEPQPEFVRWEIEDRIDETICDFTPAWHQETGTLLGIGQSVRYRDNRVMKVRPRYTGYAVYDPKSATWSKPRKLAMPSDSRFQNCGAGSVQRCDLADGRILLPVYFKRPDETQYSVAVCLCEFDGETLTYVRHGNEMTVAVDRGFAEPSVIKHGDRFFLTLRNDQHGYVTSSEDGLNYDEPQRWAYEDGTDLGNYNTQQHWISNATGLYLVYTRKGARNDHVFRHRAPLFIAQVDPQSLRVLRDTEQVLIPERGARLGNFGVTDLGANETWVISTEWMQSWRRRGRVIPTNNPYGADNSIHLAKIKWQTE